MNSMQRIKAMTEGKQPDRIGVAGWYHMPLLDQCPKDFAKGILTSCEVMKWDLCKLQYNGLFFDSAMGCTYKPSTSATFLNGTVTKFAVNHPKMFRELKVPKVTDRDIAQQLEITKRVIDGLKGEVPVIASVFSPLYCARGVYGGSARPQLLQAAIKYSPEDVHAGMEIISESIQMFLDALMEMGDVDGIFWADAFASYDDMDRETYAEFGAKYDLPLLNSIKDKTWFNMLHVHGYKNLRFDQYEELGYPVQAYNWEDRASDPTHAPMSLKQVRAMTDKILMGGVEFWHDFDSPENDREAVKAVIKARLVDALEQLGPDDKKFIFTPGCSVKMHVPEYRMQLMHEVIAEVTGID